MAFPHDDRFWVETANFVGSNSSHSQRILAPAEFEQVFPGRGVASQQVDVNRDLNIQWAILHKGRLATLTRAVLKNVHRDTHHVFANEVFVVFTNLGGLPSVPSSSPCLASYWNEFALSRPSLLTRLKVKVRSSLSQKIVLVSREAIHAEAEPEIKRLQESLP